MEALQSLLKKAEELKNQMQANIVQVEKDIEKISDKKMQDFLKNALNLAKENKITAEQFINQFNKHANGSDNK